MAIQTHDFTCPPRLPPEVKTRLANWMDRSHAIFVESIATLGPSVSVKSLGIATEWPLPALELWTGKPVGFRLILAGHSTIFALPNQLAQSLAAGLLGDSLPSDLPERELSPIEITLCELAIKTLICSLVEAWIGESSLTVELRDREPNLRRSKTFRPSEALVVCRSSVSVFGNEHAWAWMVPMETMLELFESEPSGPVSTPNAPQRQQMESVVRGMKLPLTVKLGRAQLTTSQLAELQIGDVVLLNQRTTEPLKAFVSGRPAFLGWPGQLAGNQAFQIEAELAK